MRHRQPLPALPGMLSELGSLARRWADTDLAFIASRSIIAELDRDLPEEANGLAVARWVRSRVRYTQEEPESFVGLGPLLELGAGDCDDTAAAIVALLLPLGWDCAWCIGWRGGRAVHVWPLCRPRNGRPVHLDVTPPVRAGERPWDAVRLDRVTLHDLQGRQMSELHILGCAEAEPEPQLGAIFEEGFDPTNLDDWKQAGKNLAKEGISTGNDSALAALIGQKNNASGAGTAFGLKTGKSAGATLKQIEEWVVAQQALYGAMTSFFMLMRPDQLWAFVRAITEYSRAIFGLAIYGSSSGALSSAEMQKWQSFSKLWHENALGVYNDYLNLLASEPKAELEKLYAKQLAKAQATGWSVDNPVPSDWASYGWTAPVSLSFSADSQQHAAPTAAPSVPTVPTGGGSSSNGGGGGGANWSPPKDAASWGPVAGLAMLAIVAFLVTRK